MNANVTNFCPATSCDKSHIAANASNFTEPLHRDPIFIAGLPSTSVARQAWPKVLVYQNRVAHTSAPRYIGYGR